MRVPILSKSRLISRFMKNQKKSEKYMFVNEMVEMDGKETSNQDCKVERQSKTKDLADFNDQKAKIKVDQDTQSFEDEEGIKKDPESEELGEIPFYEEEY